MGCGVVFGLVMAEMEKGIDKEINIEKSREALVVFILLFLYFV